MSDLLALLDQLDAARAAATEHGVTFPWRQDSGWGENILDKAGDQVGAVEWPTDAALIVAAVNALPKLTAALRAVATRAESEVKDAEAGARYAAEVDQTVLLRSEEARAYAWRTVQSLLTAALTPEQVQP